MPLLPPSITPLLRKIVTSKVFGQMWEHRQHIFFSRLEHLVHTAWLAHKIAPILGANIETSVTAAILHDLHHTRIRGHMHWVLAAENARQFGVSEVVLAMVRAHMFPFGIIQVPTPWTREFAVLKIADFVAASSEYLYGLFSLNWKYANNRLIPWHPDYGQFRYPETVLALAELSVTPTDVLPRR